jgi:hypothetical protein
MRKVAEKWHMDEKVAKKWHMDETALKIKKDFRIICWNFRSDPPVSSSQKSIARDILRNKTSV